MVSAEQASGRCPALWQQVRCTRDGILFQRGEDLVDGHRIFAAGDHVDGAPRQECYSWKLPLRFKNEKSP